MNKIFSLLLSCITLVACEKYLDVNEDPNYPSQLPLEMTLKQNMASVAWEMGSYYNLVGGFWSQHWAQGSTSNSYRELDQYIIGESTSNFMNNSNTWSRIYTYGISELQKSINQAESEQNWDFYLINTLIQAYTFQLMVDFYDNIPYFNFLKSDYSTSPETDPKADKGVDIYKDLIRRIDEAIEKVRLVKVTHFIETDYVFNGDIDDWIKFANTLKLKLYLRMCYFDNEYARDGIKMMYDNNDSFLEKDAKIFFNTIYDLPNPLYYYDRWVVSVNTNLYVSSSLFEYLKTNNDARLSCIIASGYDRQNLHGMPQGGYEVARNLYYKSFSIIKLEENAPFYFFSEAESYLLQAEALIRGYGDDPSKAKELYDKAIITDFQRKGIQDSAYALIATNGNYEFPVDGSMEDKLKHIIMAKWAALAGSQGAETFFELNRTGYPSISNIPAWKNDTLNVEYKGGEITYSLAGTTDGLFPKRLSYPSVEIRLNKNINEKKPVTDKVWWDVKQY